MAAVLHAGKFSERGGNRAIAFAVAASMLLHGLLLFSFPALRTQPGKPELQPGPIIARLLAPKAAPAAPAAAASVPAAPVATPAAEKAEERKAEPPPAPPKPVAAPRPEPPPAPKPAATAKPAASPVPVPAPVAKPSPERKASPAAAPEPVPAQAATEPGKPSTEVSAPPVAPASPAAGGAPAAAGPAAAPGPIARADPQPASPAESADDAGTLGRYRLALIVAAKRYKRYPRVAMDNNWEGRAEVRVVIGANGMIASISVKSSAGHEILDKQALDMITKAKPLVPIPSALKGKEFSVDVPVIFSLREDKA